MGASIPLFSLAWGDITDVFASNSDDLVDKAREVMFTFFYIGAGGFVAGWLMLASWIISG